MDLISYIKDNNLIEQKQLNSITNNFLQKKFTLYQELWRNGSKYGIEQKTLLNWAIAAGGNGYEIISTTKHMFTDAEDFAKFGGVETCVGRQLMCIRRPNKPLCILTLRPDDNGLIANLNRAFGAGEYTIGICDQNMWSTIYSLGVEPLFIEARAMKMEKKVSTEKGVSTQIEESEARSIYNMVITLGITRDASDIHIIPCDKKCNVLYRIDGTNYNLMSIPNIIAERITNILITDGKVHSKGLDRTLDGKVKYVMKNDIKNVERELRFSIMPTRRGRDINIRFLNNKLYTFADLGMSEDNVTLFKRILEMPQGLIMQVGPTGSGKSTTLYAGLSYIHENTLRNIITVEDPVEVLMEGITQVDVNEDVGLTFAQVSRQFLRHDVDVGVVGEIRDEITAAEAVRAATTGHLVISSLHTNDALGVLERLVRLGVDPYTLSEVLVAIMSQRLVRRLCPHCKREIVVNFKSDIGKIYGFPNVNEDHTFYEAVGCEHCNNIGYKGRVAVNEILLVDRTLRDMIQRHVTRKTMEDYLREQKFKTMFEDAKDKALQGITSLDELKSMNVDTLAYK